VINSLPKLNNFESLQIDSFHFIKDLVEIVIASRKAHGHTD
jgi:hypothetical protein